MSEAHIAHPQRRRSSRSALALLHICGLLVALAPALVGMHCDEKQWSCPEGSSASVPLQGAVTAVPVSVGTLEAPLLRLRGPEGVAALFERNSSPHGGQARLPATWAAVASAAPGDDLGGSTVLLGRLARGQDLSRQLDASGRLWLLRPNNANRPAETVEVELSGQHRADECQPAGLGGAQGVVTCGDGLLDTSEACDDGGALDGDGCDHACAVQGPTCVAGDGGAWTAWQCEGEPSVCEALGCSPARTDELCAARQAAWVQVAGVGRMGPSERTSGTVQLVGEVETTCSCVEGFDGPVCSEACRQQIPPCALWTATPPEGGELLGWVGGCSGQGACQPAGSGQALAGALFRHPEHGVRQVATLQALGGLPGMVTMVDARATADGGVVVAGSFLRELFVGGQALHAPHPEGPSAFVVRLAPDGTPSWSRALSVAPGDAALIVRSLAVAEDGEVLLLIALRGALLGADDTVEFEQSPERLRLTDVHTTSTSSRSLNALNAGLALVRIDAAGAAASAEPLWPDDEASALADAPSVVRAGGDGVGVLATYRSLDASGALGPTWIRLLWLAAEPSAAWERVWRTDPPSHEQEAQADDLALLTDGALTISGTYLREGPPGVPAPTGDCAGPQRVFVQRVKRDGGLGKGRTWQGVYWDRSSTSSLAALPGGGVALLGRLPACERTEPYYESTANQPVVALFWLDANLQTEQARASRRHASCMDGSNLSRSTRIPGLLATAPGLDDRVVTARPHCASRYTPELPGLAVQVFAPAGEESWRERFGSVSGHDSPPAALAALDDGAVVVAGTASAPIYAGDTVIEPGGFVVWLQP